MKETKRTWNFRSYRGRTIITQRYIKLYRARNFAQGCIRTTELHPTTVYKSHMAVVGYYGGVINAAVCIG
jgi:hypothetical protein